MGIQAPWAPGIRASVVGAADTLVYCQWGFPQSCYCYARYAMMVGIVLWKVRMPVDNSRFLGECHAGYNETLIDGITPLLRKEI